MGIPFFLDQILKLNSLITLCSSSWNRYQLKIISCVLLFGTSVLWFLLRIGGLKPSCPPLGPCPVGCLPGPVHDGWRRRPRGHQPHSETTQEGGTIISGALLAVQTGVAHNTLLVNSAIKCLMNRIQHFRYNLPKRVIRAMTCWAKRATEAVGGVALADKIHYNNAWQLSMRGV